MRLSELIELVKIESGQYELDLEELPDTKYKLLLERKVLPILNRHIPYNQEATIIVTDSPYTYITTDIPEWLSSIYPANTVSASNIILTGQFRQNLLVDIKKPTFLWRYVKPKLYLEYTGDMLVTEIYYAKLTETDDEDYTIDLFKDDSITYMTNLLLGYVMVSIGRGRRAAVINELPITLDTDALVSEGNEIILSTLDEIKIENNFELAIGV